LCAMQHERAGDGRDPVRAAWERRRGRFAADARAHTSPWVRGALVVAGALLLALGLIGIVVPVLPTTPFVLLAAACFVRASPRLYDAVLSNGVIGPSVYAWRTTRTIPRRVRGIAIGVVVVTFASSIAFAVRPLWGRLLMGALGLALVTWIARIPTTPRGAAVTSREADRPDSESPP